MWGTILITAAITALLTVALASVLVILFLVPHIERKVDWRLKRTATEIEQGLRERASSVFRTRKQIAKGIGVLFSRAAPIDAVDKPLPPVLDETNGEDSQS